MIKYFCDRCGAETPAEALTLNVLHGEREIYNGSTVELCPDCQKALDHFIKEKPKATYHSDVAYKILPK